MLTASLNSPGQAQGWINSIVNKSRILNTSEDRPSSAKSRSFGKKREDVPSATPPAEDSMSHTPTLNLSTRPFPAPFGANGDATTKIAPTADCTGLPPKPSSVFASVPEEKRPARENRQRDAAKPKKLPHTAHAVPDGDYEPRTRLMWSIVSQASSVDWKDRPKSVSASATAEPSSLASIPTSSDIATDQQGATILPEAHLELPPIPGTADWEPSLPIHGIQQASPQLEGRGDGGVHFVEYGGQIKSDWAELQPELLGCIAKGFRSASPLQQMVSTCR